MSEAPVFSQTYEGVMTIRLDRPDKLNALTASMLTRLDRLFEQAADDEGVRAILLTGTGRAFCAGQDLAERVFGENDPPPDLGETLERLYHPLIGRIASIEKPVVAAVNGIAAGAGCNLALACDLVLAARSASFIQAFSRIGLVPDAGGTWMLPRLAGLQRAMGMALLGESIGAEEALRWGLIWRLVEDEGLLPEAEVTARRLAEGPTRALAWTKRLLRQSSGNSLAEQLELERDLQRDAGRTADFREGVRAFIEKRPARFRGC